MQHYKNEVWCCLIMIEFLIQVGERRTRDDNIRRGKVAQWAGTSLQEDLESHQTGGELLDAGRRPIVNPVTPSHQRRRKRTVYHAQTVLAFGTLLHLVHCIHQSYAYHALRKLIPWKKKWLISGLRFMRNFRSYSCFRLLWQTRG